MYSAKFYLLRPSSADVRLPKCRNHVLAEQLNGLHYLGVFHRFGGHEELDLVDAGGLVKPDGFDTTLGVSSYDHSPVHQRIRVHLLPDFVGQGVPAGSVLTAEDLVSDPHLQERGFFQEFNNVNCPHLGSRTYAGRPFRMAEIPMVIEYSASLGEHNEQVLRELAGLSTEEIGQLQKAGVIANRPKPDEPPP